jgi:putative protein-disulfide isomerase
MNIKEYVLEIVSFTDPYCTWCWGSEPILRRIEETFGSQIRISFVMGGLVKNMNDFHDAANNIGGEDWANQVAAHWHEASERHGMPVDVRVFLDMKSSFSTYPANIAFKAAQIQDLDIAVKYLRRLREAASAERKLIHQPQVQAELASEVGLDPDRLLSDIEGPAKDAFESDLKLCQKLGVTGFPTFLIRNRQNEGRLLRGYQPFQSFKIQFDVLAGQDLKEKQIIADKPNIMAFIKKYGKVAPKEVSEVFSLSDKATESIIKEMENDGCFVKQPAGNGVFLLPLSPEPKI